jgi:hypothetical protein
MTQAKNAITKIQPLQSSSNQTNLSNRSIMTDPPKTKTRKPMLTDGM